MKILGFVGALAFSSASIAQPFVPPDGGFADVTAFGAVCDGVADDWAAFQAAIESVPGGSFVLRNVSVPNRRCAVSKQITAKRSDGTWLNYLGIYGSGPQSEVYLLPASADFQDPNAPQAVIYTASKWASGVDPAAWGPTGSGAQAYRNFVHDLKITVGKGNPGAKGVDFLANNVGSLRNLHIVSEDGQGVAGVQMTRYGPGPALLRNVTVQGFQRGIDASQGEYSMTLEDVLLVGYTVEAIRNNTLSLSARRLTTIGSGRALSNTAANGLVVLLDSALQGGLSGTDAITSAGKVLLRNVTATGFDRVMSGAGGLSVAEYASHGPFSAFTADDRTTLGLPIEDPPHAFSSDCPADRVNAVDLGANPDDALDDGNAIRASVATGKPIVYATGRGIYRLNSPVNIPASVRVVDLLGAKLQAATGAPPCLLNVNEASSEPLVLRRFVVGGVPGTVQPFICQTAARDVLYEDATAGVVRIDAAAGKTHLDDAIAFLSISPGKSVWARQLNSEGAVNPLQTNAGKLWVLGLKTEGAVHVTNTLAGGCTEILGGLLYPVAVTSQTIPAHIVTDARASFSFAESAGLVDRRYGVLVRETRGGATQDILHSALPSRGFGLNVPLASAHVGACP